MEKAIPYRGDAPYIFISYAHKDVQSVLPIIGTMQASGFRIWFDEGIDPGTEWDNVIAEQIEKSSYFLAFVSENYLASENCKDELNFARDLGKHRLLVYLEDVTLPSGMAMRMNRIQSVFKYKYLDESAFYKVLYSADGIYAMCDGAPKEEPAPNTSNECSREAPPQSKPYNPGIKPGNKREKKDLPLATLLREIALSPKYDFYTLDRVLARLFALCVYGFLFALGTGSPIPAAVSLIFILPFGIGSRIAEKKGRAKKPETYYHLDVKKDQRNFLLRNFARCWFGFALALMRNPGPVQNFFLFWAVYCFVVSFIPRGYTKIRIGQSKIPCPLIHALAVVFSVIAHGMAM